MHGRQAAADQGQANGGVIPDDPATVEQIHGIMGAGAAQYFGFIKLQREMPKYEEIVTNPSNVNVPTKPDAQMLVCYYSGASDQDQGRSGRRRVHGAHAEEFAVTFATTACKKQPMLVAEPAFDKWARQNSSLMAAIAFATRRDAA